MLKPQTITYYNKILELNFFMWHFFWCKKELSIIICSSVSTKVKLPHENKNRRTVKVKAAEPSAGQTDEVHQLNWINKSEIIFSMSHVIDP